MYQYKPDPERYRNGKNDGHLNKPCNQIKFQQAIFELCKKKLTFGTHTVLTLPTKLNIHSAPYIDVLLNEDQAKNLQQALTLAVDVLLCPNH